ncbi:MAG: hypothetical protein AAFP19_13375, partial [Bacteroidota bacterium]
PEYRVIYYESLNDNTPDTENIAKLYRKRNDQIAGYTSTTAGGARWNFALPVVNHTQQEVVFSAPAESTNTDQCRPTIPIPKNGGELDYKPGGKSEEYLSITETPAYAHSYLLTSIFGVDYIDANGNGPDDEDSGYWLNIKYYRTHDATTPYKWRAPYLGANYVAGLNNKAADNKGSFLYGERDQYLPAKLETKTHVAEFFYSSRKDGRGANDWLQDENSSSIAAGAYSYKLDKVIIYSKLESVDEPMKTVHFRYAGYNYDDNNDGVNDNLGASLCPGVPNNIDNFSGAWNPNGSGGKLTLKKVFMTYEDNTRGRLTPYEFDYNNGDYSARYNPYEFDRWGTYKPNPNQVTDKCANIYNPYVDQNDPNINDNVMAWHLSSIKLPSGAEISVDVGRDHYGYVQDRVATQMFKITSFGDTQANKISKDKDPAAEKRRVYFSLENPIPDDANADTELAKYFEDLYQVARNGQVYKQIYFKVNLDVANRGINEDVAGYAEMKEDAFGFDNGSLNGNGEYTRAYVELEPFPIPVKGKNYHPILMTSWQFVKNNAPDLLLNYDLGSRPNTEKAKAKKVKKLKDKFNNFLTAFKSYYINCRDKDFGRTADLSRSYLRLNTPDKMKYGGGVRVNKVSIKDNWTDELTPNYGNVYEYETEEMVYDPTLQKMVPTGNKISSGVAANEPSVGNDENVLKYAKQYTEDLRLRTDNLQTFEYPINESYYPGASVGYSKVTMKTLATDYAIKRKKNETLPPSEQIPLPEEYNSLPAPLPDGFHTTGMSVSEFYTARDFPIITRETHNLDASNPFKLIVIPFIGQLRNDHYYGSQGYSIELNNMHGKPYKTTNYGMDKDNQIIDTPLDWVRYDYQFDEEVYTEGGKQRIRKILNNNFTVIKDDDPAASNVEEEIAEIGVDREMFMDLRESDVLSIRGGVDVNTDILWIGPFPIPAFVPWPEIGEDHTNVKTAVTNKVIRRSGIVKQIVANDGQSLLTTENLKFDPYSGTPLLSRVNNNFGDPIYSYKVPAHFGYEGMGPAYENAGLKFQGSISATANSCNGYFEVTLSGADNGVLDKLYEGDEFIVSNNATDIQVDISDFPPSVSVLPANQAITRATLVIKEENTGLTRLYFDFDDQSNLNTSPDNTFYLVRSGRRNLMAANIGNITTVSVDPTVNRQAAVAGNDLATIRIPSSSSASTSQQVDVDYKTIDQVVSAKAITYNDLWEGVEDCDDTEALNPYRSGKKGIWRQHKNYTYVGQRAPVPAGSSSPVAMDISQDGTLDDVPIFDHSNPFFNYCPGTENWRLESEASKYGYGGEELENRNITNQYSAALYGYNDNLTTALATNARYFEIGYEGFEEYTDEIFETEDEVALGDFGPINSGNIDLFCTGEVRTLTESYNIVGGYSGGSYITIDQPYHNGIQAADEITLALIDENGKQYLVETTVTGISGTNANDYNMPDLAGGQISVLQIDNSAVCGLPSGQVFSGRVSLEYCNTYDSNSGVCDATQVGYYYRFWGFYGDYIFCIADLLEWWQLAGTTVSINDPITTDIQSLVDAMNTYYPEGQWVPRPGYDYHIMSTNPNLNTSDLGAIKVSGDNDNGNGLYCALSTHLRSFSASVNTVFISDEVAHTGRKSLKVQEGTAKFQQKSMKLVEGKKYVLSAWVHRPNTVKYDYASTGIKVRVRMANDGNSSTQDVIDFVPEGPIIEEWQRVEGVFEYNGESWWLELVGGSIPAYIDDLRIFPMTGNLETYVYDPQSYRLTEILDANNYFARYIYDSEGQLIITNKETEEGIKTIRESHTYLKSTANF